MVRGNKTHDPSAAPFRHYGPIPADWALGGGDTSAAVPGPPRRGCSSLATTARELGIRRHWGGEGACIVASGSSPPGVIYSRWPSGRLVRQGAVVPVPSRYPTLRTSETSTIVCSRHPSADPVWNLMRSNNEHGRWFESGAQGLLIGAVGNVTVEANSKPLSSRSLMSQPRPFVHRLDLTRF